jgi:hypothetical protein
VQLRHIPKSLWISFESRSVARLNATNIFVAIFSLSTKPSNFSKMDRSKVWSGNSNVTGLKRSWIDKRGSIFNNDAVLFLFQVEILCLNTLKFLGIRGSRLEWKLDVVNIAPVSLSWTSTPSRLSLGCWFARAFCRLFNNSAPIDRTLAGILWYSSKHTQEPHDAKPF